MRKLGSLLAVAVFTFAAVVAAGPATASENCEPQLDAGDITGKRVLVLTHGWRGAGLTEARTELASKLGTGWTVTTFDYTATNTLWPDDSGAAECLRTRIRALHEQSGSADANVYLAGHSMGGLLIRFALDPREDPTVGDLVGGVVTLDTPHLGSPFGSTAMAELLSYQTSQSFGGDAAVCLALHHPGLLPDGCGYPPYLPSEIPVAQVAGNVSLTRTFMAFGTDRIELNSDGTVWVPSQTGYVTSNDQTQSDQPVSATVLDCEYGWGAAAATAGRLTDGVFASLANPLGAANRALFQAFNVLTGRTVEAMMAGTDDINDHLDAMAALGATSAEAPCGHSKVTTWEPALQQITEDLESMTPRHGAVGEVRATLPVGATWLYELTRGNKADFYADTSGDKDTAQIVDGGETVNYPDSTNQWIGCGGDVSSVTYYLDGLRSGVSLVFAMQAHAPEGLTANIEVRADTRAWSSNEDELLYSGSATRGGPLERIELDVTDLKDIAVRTWTDDPCGFADKGYGALVQSFAY